MISVSGRKWIEKQINKNSIEKIKQDFNFSEIVSKLIISRNFDYNEIYSIENPSIIRNEFKNDKDFIDATLLLSNHGTTNKIATADPITINPPNLSGTALNIA